VHTVGSYCANISRYMVHKTLNFSTDVYSAFSYFLKLVRDTIMSDRLRWLKSADDNLKIQPIEFWKYVSNLKRKTDGQIVRDSRLAFAFIGWNSVIPTNSSTIESVQNKFANLCYNRFFFNLGSTSLEAVALRSSVPYKCFH